MEAAEIQQVCKLLISFKLLPREPNSPHIVPNAPIRPFGSLPTDCLGLAFFQLLESVSAPVDVLIGIFEQESSALVADIPSVLRALALILRFADMTLPFDESIQAVHYLHVIG